MRSLILSLALAGLSAGAAHAQAARSPAVFASEAFANADLIPLSMLDFEPAERDLWSGLAMLGADLIGPAGDDLGDVEDVLVTVDGYAVALVVELDELLEFNETMLTIPLSVLDPMPSRDAVRSPVALDGLEMYSAFDTRTLTAEIVSDRVAAIADDDLDAVVTGSDVFLLDETLLGEYAPLAGDAQGYVHDLLFSMEGRIEGVVIAAARDAFDGLAVPFTGSTRSDEPSVLEAAPFTAEEMGVRD